MLCVLRLARGCWFCCTSKSFCGRSCFLSYLGRYVPVVNVYVPLRILRHVYLSLLFNFVVGLWLKFDIYISPWSFRQKLTLRQLLDEFFCHIQNNQGRNRSYQQNPKAERAHNPYRVLNYSGYHKNWIW